MNAMEWLTTVTQADSVSELQEFFKSCNRDVTGDVAQRVKVLLEGIFPSHLVREDEQRKLEAASLYYRVLNRICVAESQRLHNKNLSSLLFNERFHRCMVACSAELIIAVHRIECCQFPAILYATGITSFDLSKVIESFVRHEENLPRELKQHLNSIEERLLESMAWEKGSSLYNSLIVARPNLSKDITRLCLQPDPMPSLDMLSASATSKEVIAEASSPQRTAPRIFGNELVNPLSFISPLKERSSAFSPFNSAKRHPNNLQSVFASPHKQSPQGDNETCADTALRIFFQKMLKLAAIRIKLICERVSEEITEQVYHVVHYALNTLTNLFFQRHIDQIILSSIYALCKVNKLSISFREIILHYQKQPHAKDHVFQNVFITKGTKAGDLIRFYNEVFVPATKSYLTSLPNAALPKDRDEAPASPKSTAFPSVPDMSPRKVSTKHNVFVSPLRNTKVDKIMSPHSKSLYACVGESTRAYQSPSKDLTAINNSLNRQVRFGRIEFEGLNDEFVNSSSCKRARLYL